jgi:mono/diheme cytochrome c family protein
LTAQVKIPGVSGTELDPALRGRVLIEEMNCVACHGADSLSTTSRKSPRLSAVGTRVNPNYLEAFIADPHAVKPGTPMPDLLRQLPQPERQDVAKAIAHFLVSLNRNGEAPFELQAPDSVAAERGERLFHSVGCVACHSPRDPDGKELLVESSVPLGALEAKYSFKSLSEFLRRPHQVRPSGRMPDMRLPAQEVEQITHYLLQKTVVPGHLKFVSWRGKVWEGLDGDVEKEKAGQVENFSLAAFGNIAQHTAIQYAGFLRVDAAGDYTFDLECNGAIISVDGAEVVHHVPSDRRGIEKFSGDVSLKEGWNRIEVTYFHTGRKPSFSLELSGPGLPRGPIPTAKLAISDKTIPVLQALKVDPALVAKGKMQFEKLGCAQCHDDLGFAQKNYIAMPDLDPVKGCLGESDAAPHFDLGAEQKRQIAAALPGIESTKLNDRQMVNKTLATFNCTACHDRAGLGGISLERDPYFTGTREELGEQGRLPPPLTHVGAKLTKDWLEQVMVHGARQRHYLNTRMPIFGEANVGHLIERFEKVDTLEKLELPPIANIRESKKAGYDMIGTEGFSCIACHDFNGQKSGAGALELVGVTDRLKKNWFHLYMRQPSRFHQTVIMPSYWPGGESIRKELLGGDTNQQIEALWAYLSDGKRAKSPIGLSRQSNELRVAAETVMCRGRGTAGYRGIGVGYPERISLAFDSEEMALRVLWKGEFASVNNGSFRVRGDQRIEFPAGIPFHRLTDMDDSWPYKGKTNYLFPQDQGYEYRGYRLDKEKRPTFMYRYGDITVRDFFEDQLDENGEAYFRRTMTFDTASEQQPFFFRVGSGKVIERMGGGWKVDGLTVAVPQILSATVRDGDPKELLLSIALPKGETVLQFEYRWKK